MSTEAMIEAIRTLKRQRERIGELEARVLAAEAKLQDLESSSCKRTRFATDSDQSRGTRTTYASSHRYITTEKEGEIIACRVCTQYTSSWCKTCNRCHVCSEGIFCKGDNRRIGLRALLEKRMDRAIWLAFRFGDCDPALGLITSAGMSPDFKRAACGSTLLMAACFWGKHDVVDRLRGLGCDIGITNAEGRTADSFAVEKGHSEIVSSPL